MASGWDSAHFCLWCKRLFNPTTANLRTTKQKYCGDTHKKLAQRARHRVAAAILFLAASSLPAVTPTPTPPRVSPGSSIQMVNTMKVATPVWYAEQNRYTLPTVVRAVKVAVTQSEAPPLAFSESLPGAFLPVGGVAYVQAPTTAGQWYIHARYEFDGENGTGQQAIATKPFVVLAQAPTPVPCVDTPLGRPGPFGQCFTCAGNPIPGVEIRGGVCTRITGPTPTPRPPSTPRPTATPSGDCAAPGGIPGPFGQCYDCAGHSIGVQPCTASVPTATPRPPAATATPRPTPTPCLDTRYGRPGPFGHCYTCAGEIVPDAEVGSGGICGPPRVFPTPTATAVPTEVPTAGPTPPVEATATPPPATTPPSGKKGCGGCGGTLFGGLAAIATLLVAKRLW